MSLIAVLADQLPDAESVRALVVELFRRKVLDTDALLIGTPWSEEGARDDLVRGHRLAEVFYEGSGWCLWLQRQPGIDDYEEMGLSSREAAMERADALLREEGWHLLERL